MQTGGLRPIQTAPEAPSGGHEPHDAPPPRRRPPKPHSRAQEDDLAGWGTPDQIALCRQTLDETLRHDPKPGSLRAAVADHVAQFDASGASTVRVLAAMRQFCEQRWRKPEVSEYVACQLFDRKLFTAFKAIDLLRYERTPSEVDEGFVKATGNVGEAAIAPRLVFWQRFRPLGPERSGIRPSGKTFLVVPGIGETGRAFYDQIMQLNGLGHEVVVMDCMWAGQTRNLAGDRPDGNLDRGFGTARDVARVAEFVCRHLAKDGRLLLLGQGSGGAAVLMLLVAQAAGLLETTLPARIDAVLQAPYLAPTPSNQNRLVTWLGRMPLSREMSGAAIMPRPTSDASAARGLARMRKRDAVQVRLGGPARMQADLETTWRLLRENHRPQGRIAVLHAADDPWADPAASHRLSQPGALGRHAAVRILSGDNHALGQVASEREAVRWGLQQLGAYGRDSVLPA